MSSPSSAFTANWNQDDLTRKQNEDRSRLAILQRTPTMSPSLIVRIKSPILHTPVNYHRKHVILSGRPVKARFAEVTIDVSHANALTNRMPNPLRRSVSLMRSRDQFVVGGSVTTLLQKDVDMEAVARMDIDVIGTGSHIVENMKALFTDVIIECRAQHGCFGAPGEEFDYAVSRTADGVTLTIPAYLTSCVDIDPFSYITCPLVPANKYSRPIVLQFICRAYIDLEHALTGFDLPACCVAFDGEQVLALPRGLEALQTGSNLVDDDRQSLTYEKRLLKYYYTKGFDIVLPGVDTMMISMISPFQNIGSRMEKFVSQAFHMKAKMGRGGVSPVGGSYAGGLRFNLFGSMGTVVNRAYNAAHSLSKSGVNMIIVTSFGSSDRHVGRQATDMDDPASRIDLLLASTECFEIAGLIAQLPFALVRGECNSFRMTRDGSLYD